jgi:hypothetical protein
MTLTVPKEFEESLAAEMQKVEQKGLVQSRLFDDGEVRWSLTTKGKAVFETNTLLSSEVADYINSIIL